MIEFACNKTRINQDLAFWGGPSLPPEVFPFLLSPSPCLAEEKGQRRRIARLSQNESCVWKYAFPSGCMKRMSYPYQPTYLSNPQALNGHFHASHLPWDTTADLASSAAATAPRARSVVGRHYPQPAFRPPLHAGVGGGVPGAPLPPARADLHLTCLHLGKRRCFESERAVGDRRCKTHHGGGAAAAAVPRCQVEGCHVALGDAKEYHRRHKVCESHSKAPGVVMKSTMPSLGNREMKSRTHPEYVS